MPTDLKGLTLSPKYYKYSLTKEPRVGLQPQVCALILIPLFWHSCSPALLMHTRALTVHAAERRPVNHSHRRRKTRLNLDSCQMWPCWQRLLAVVVVDLEKVSVLKAKGDASHWTPFLLSETIPHNLKKSANDWPWNEWNMVVLHVH